MEAEKKQVTPSKMQEPIAVSEQEVPDHSDDEEQPVSTTTTDSNPTSPIKNGLQLPTKHHHLTSRFPYPTVLHSYGIDEDTWKACTSELFKDVRLSTGQKWKAHAIGTAIGVATTSFIGPRGVRYAVRQANKSRSEDESKNLEQIEHTGQLEEVLQRWNEKIFQPKGLSVKLELRGEASDVGDMDVATPLYKLREKEAEGRGGEGWVHDKRVQLAEKREGKQRRKALMSERLVILPYVAGATHH